MESGTKIILVTGGNRGIGLEICRQLDLAGHTVIMGTRNLEKGRVAAKSLTSRVVVCQLDVTEEESVQRLKTYLLSNYGRLDVLVNNAGLGERAVNSGSGLLDGTIRVLGNSLQGLRKKVRKIIPADIKERIAYTGNRAARVPLADVKHLMETNFFGAWRMIQVFLPLLEKSKDGRIINVSSGNGQFQNLSGRYPAYSISKAALNALTIMFANELENKNISVNALCPGWVRTDMGGPDAPRSVSEGADTAVWLATANDIPTGKFFMDRREMEW